jgi:carbon monoxide dehydrogenase subunit G
MKLEGTQKIRAPRAALWQLLIDPQVLRRCVPGCEALESNADGSYRLTLKAGIGSIRGVYQGTIRLEDQREPEHYRMIVDGKGSTGFVKGAGTLDLIEEGDETMVNYAGDVNVGGTIASVGARMIQTSAKIMVGQFFTALEAEAEAHQRSVASDAPVIPPKHGFFGTP